MFKTKPMEVKSDWGDLSLLKHAPAVEGTAYMVLWRRRRAAARKYAEAKRKEGV